MDMQIPVNKRKISIPDEIRDKWQALLRTMVEAIDVSAAVIAMAKPPHLKIFLHNESTRSPQKLHISDDLIETYCNVVVTTEHKCKVTNTLKEKELKRIKATKTGVVSYLGMPLLWPDGDIFGVICVFDTKENHYAGKSTKLMVQFK